MTATDAAIIANPTATPEGRAVTLIGRALLRSLVGHPGRTDEIPDTIQEILHNHVGLWNFDTTRAALGFAVIDAYDAGTLTDDIRRAVHSAIHEYWTAANTAAHTATRT